MKVQTSIHMLRRGKLRTNKSSRLKVHYTLEFSYKFICLFLVSYHSTLNKGLCFLHLMLNTTERLRQKLEDW